MCLRWLGQSSVLYELGRHETQKNTPEMNTGSVWKGGTAGTTESFQVTGRRETNGCILLSFRSASPREAVRSASVSVSRGWLWIEWAAGWPWAVPRVTFPFSFVTVGLRFIFLSHFYDLFHDVF